MMPTEKLRNSTSEPVLLLIVTFVEFCYSLEEDEMI